MKKDEIEEFILNHIGCNNTNFNCMTSKTNACEILQDLVTKFCQSNQLYDTEENWPRFDSYHYYLTLWTIVVPIIFSIIIVIGIFGNGLVIYVVFTTPKLKTSTHMFLVNLAISDLTFLSICVPFQAYKYAASDWYFGDVWCMIIQYLLYVTLFVTIWTLVCIAAIRYIVLVHSNSKLRKLVDQPVLICIILWVLMLILHIPTLLVHRVNRYKHEADEYSYCGIQQGATKQVFLALFVCAYVIPLCLICVLYVQVICYLHGNNRSQSLCNSRNHTARVSKVMLVIVLVFTASWLPYHVHSLISYYGHIPDNRYYEVLRIVWHCMAYSNSLANPFIYNFASNDFRTAFRYVLCCHRKRRQGRNTTMTLVHQLQES